MRYPHSLIWIAVACSGCASKQEENSPRTDISGVNLEIRKAAFEPTEGYSETAAFDKEKEVFIWSNPEITRQDVKKAYVYELDGSMISVTLSRDATVRMKQLSRDHMGKFLAILVDGVVIATPRVVSELPGEGPEGGMGIGISAEVKSHILRTMKKP